jgi:peptide/nickel transport system substrate-binding protein
MNICMGGRRVAALLALLGTTAVVASGSAQAPAVASLDGKKGGTFNVSFFGESFDHVDPALSYSFPAWAVLDATCPRLMSYPDKPPPEGLRLAPEVAASFPRVSRDAKTFTFTLRTDFRFSDGTPVRANAFARAISRTLAPGVRSPGAQYTRDIVGAGAVRAGKRTTPTGIVAVGNRLVIRLTRPAPDFLARTTMPFFCAVPPTLPSDPEGIGASPGAGPYYVSEYVRGRRVVLERNRFYGGSRPHHVDRFVVDLQSDVPEEVLDRIESGEADWGWVPPPFYFDPARRFAQKYGVNRSRFFVKSGLGLRGYHLNSARPLFRNNPNLRRAVNFAVDRRVLARRAGSRLAGRATDQYLPPSMPGFRDVPIYPLGGPDVRRARSFARGHTRGGKAVLWALDVPVELASAQIVKRNLEQIGLEVEVKGLPPQLYFSRIPQRDAPFDIAQLTWTADYVDPYQYTNVLFDGRFIGLTNFPHFDSPVFNGLMRDAARLQGEGRYRAYGRVDVQLARDAAPMVAVAYENEATLVSKRVGCIVLRPALVMTVACLK